MDWIDWLVIVTCGVRL